MNEPYRYGVLHRYGIFKILLSCLALMIVQFQVLPVMASDNSSQQQTRNIRGVVTDETGAPFPFVSVYVEGRTSIGSITNEKGEYRIAVPPNSTLSFAFVGYKTLLIPVTASDVLDVRMELDTKALDEVIVLGFQEQRRASVSAAVSTVRADQIRESPVANITNALAGRLPGLTTMQGGGQPGLDYADLYIRGVSTWNATSPLYVIDGVERSATSFRLLDPEEIESISILKDAAATAVYGTKGANGVLIVNTKRGQVGAPQISVTSQATIQQFIRRPKLLGSYDALVLFNEALMNDGLDPAYTEEELQKYKDGSDRYRYPNTDWYDLMMRPYAPQYNLSANVSGGSRTLTYYVSAGYMKQEGQLKTQQGRVYNPEFAYRRLNFRANIDALITESFTATLEFGGNLDWRSDPYNQMNIFAYMNRIGSWVMPPVNPNGSYAGTSEFPDMNPYWSLNTMGSDLRMNNNITSAIKLRFDMSNFVKGLRLEGRIAFDSNYNNGKYWTQVMNTYQLISRAGRADRYKQYLEKAYFGNSASLGSASRNMDALISANYNRRFGNHNLGGQFLSNVAEQISGSGIPYHSASFVARTNYSFKNKYNLELNGSYRGSENFAPGRRFGLFPSFSASWNMHEEGFMNSLGFISILKPRFSIGKTGNDYVGTRFLFKEGKWTTSTGAAAYFGPTVGTSLGYSTEPSIANPLATWETEIATNYGVDVALFRNKIDISFDRWFKNRTGILQTSQSFSGLLGIGVPELNIGKTTSNGWEVQLTFSHRFNSNFRMSFSPNMSYFENKIIFRDEPEDMQWWLKQEGKPISQPTGYIVLGYFKNQEEIDNSPVQQVGSTPIPGDFKYLDYNGDGRVDIYDQVPISYTAVPNITYGASISATLKNISLSAHFQGATMSSIYISQYLMWEFYNRASVQEHHLGRWTPETADKATYPVLHLGSVSQNHTSNTFWRKDNSYLRLKSLRLGYSLPATLGRRLGVKGMSLNVSGTNLITWDKLKILDPETSTGTATSQYPQSKTYQMGINIIF